jgi:hypothetical protein
MPRLLPVDSKARPNMTPCQHDGVMRKHGRTNGCRSTERWRDCPPRCLGGRLAAPGLGICLARREYRPPPLARARHRSAVCRNSWAAASYGCSYSYICSDAVRLGHTSNSGSPAPVPSPADTRESNTSTSRGPAVAANRRASRTSSQGSQRARRLQRQEGTA